VVRRISATFPGDVLRSSRGPGVLRLTALIVELLTFHCRLRYVVGLPANSLPIGDPVSGTAAPPIVEEDEPKGLFDGLYRRLSVPKCEVSLRSVNAPSERCISIVSSERLSSFIRAGG